MKSHLANYRRNLGSGFLKAPHRLGIDALVESRLLDRGSQQNSAITARMMYTSGVRITC